MRNVLFIVALASCLPGICQAAGAEPTSEALLACSKLQDPAERVRCYDTQVATLKPAASAPVAPAVPAPVPSTASHSSASAVPAAAAQAQKQAAPGAPTPEFGAEQLPMAARAPQAQEERVLHSSITSMREVGHRSYVIALSNGQVWHQEGALTTMFFKVGDDVRIKKGILGSYHMWTATTGDKNWVRVTRLQ